MATAIGIDLGTTYSSVSVFQHDKVDIIYNDQGYQTTPSFVAFTDTERLIGAAAKYQAARNPTNTIFDVKRLIGKRFDDPIVRDDMKLWPFKVVNDGGKPKIKVQVKGNEKVFSPGEISSMILLKMKETAEAYLGKEITRAVLTLPGCFNEFERQATKDAGKMAGLHMLDVISEGTAAGIAYGLYSKVRSEHNVLIFDLGGGTLDVSVVTIEEGIIEVRGTAGNTQLGGRELDSMMVDYFLKEFKRKYRKDISKDERALMKLRTACEGAKRTLTSTFQANIEIDSLFEGIDFLTSLSRAKFEWICHDKFREILKSVTKALNHAALNKSEISDVMLAGGCSRIPKIQKLLKEYFNGKELNKSIHPDEAVAHGAAIHAAILCGDKSQVLEDILLIGMLPFSLGIGTAGGVMMVIIEMNNSIPTRKSKVISTSFDKQSDVYIPVFRGQQTMTKNNYLLGKLELMGIPPAPRGVPQIEVVFDIDWNGIFRVSAEDKSTGKNNTITISTDIKKFQPEEKKTKWMEAATYAIGSPVYPTTRSNLLEKYQPEDMVKKLMEAKYTLGSHVYPTTSKLPFGPHLPAMERLSKDNQLAIDLLDGSMTERFLLAHRPVVLQATVDIDTKSILKKTITNNKGLLRRKDIYRKVDDAEEYASDEKQHTLNIENKSVSNNYSKSIKGTREDVKT